MLGSREKFVKMSSKEMASSEHVDASHGSWRKKVVSTPRCLSLLLGLVVDHQWQWLGSKSEHVIASQQFWNRKLVVLLQGDAMSASYGCCRAELRWLLLLLLTCSTYHSLRHLTLLWNTASVNGQMSLVVSRVCFFKVLHCIVVRCGAVRLLVAECVVVSLFFCSAGALDKSSQLLGRTASLMQTV